MFVEPVLRPEDLGPPVGERLHDEQLASAFGLSEPPTDGRTNGHLFLRVTEPGRFVKPDRLRYLDGTPKGATRWIDTGWALGLASRRAKP